LEQSGENCYFKWNSPRSPNVHITPITTIKIEIVAKGGREKED
jgi:hypothetical protein